MEKTTPGLCIVERVPGTKQQKSKRGTKLWFGKVTIRHAKSAFSFAVLLAAIMLILAYGLNGFGFCLPDIWRLVNNAGAMFVIFLLLYYKQQLPNKDLLPVQLKPYGQEAAEAEIVNG